MPGEEVLADRYAEPRSVGDFDLAVPDPELLFDEIVQQRVGAERIFDDETGRGCCGNMQTGGKCWGAGPKMRREPQIVGAGQRGDAPRFGDAAADGESRLEDG